MEQEYLTNVNAVLQSTEVDTQLAVHTQNPTQLGYFVIAQSDP